MNLNEFSKTLFVPIFLLLKAFTWSRALYNLNLFKHPQMRGSAAVPEYQHDLKCNIAFIQQF